MYLRGQVECANISSSAYAIIPYLTERKNITVITCGVQALMQLGKYGITACSTGVRLLPSCMSLVDSDAMRTNRNTMPILSFSPAEVFRPTVQLFNFYRLLQGQPAAFIIEYIVYYSLIFEPIYDSSVPAVTGMIFSSTLSIS